MLALSRPLHGYAVMQRVAELSRGSVTVGPGTLYGAFVTLETQKLIEKVGEEGRRKVYGLTALGGRVLAAHTERLRTMTRAGAANGRTTRTDWTSRRRGDRTRPTTCSSSPTRAGSTWGRWAAGTTSGGR